MSGHSAWRDRWLPSCPMDSVLEIARLRSLEALRILDTEPEEEFDAIVKAAGVVADTPIALVSLVADTRQWFKACIGLDATGTSRDVSFCAHAIETPDDRFIVTDARRDPRFCSNPLVVGGPGIRFYYGVPLRDRDGLGLGTLCVIDTVPRSLEDDRLDEIEGLARVVERLLMSRRLIDELDQTQRSATLFEAGVTSSPVAHQLLGPDGTIRRANDAFAALVGSDLADVIGRNAADFVDDDARVDLSLFPDRPGEAPTMRAEGLRRYVRADGSAAWGEATVTPVFPDGHDHPETRVDLVHIVDRTTLVEARCRERELVGEVASSERRLRALIDPSPDAILRCTTPTRSPRSTSDGRRPPT